ncbi:MAG TPA: transketolase, partial [Turneriella sp.]|nr:transketolase [Turneriella sp.]
MAEKYIVGDAKAKAHLTEIQNKKPSDITREDLKFLATRVRQNVVEMIFRAASGHPGGPLGLADIYTY